MRRSLATLIPILFVVLAVSSAAFADAKILIDSSGNLYSTTRGGGAYSAGTVFKISNTGL